MWSWLFITLLFAFWLMLACWVLWFGWGVVLLVNGCLVLVFLGLLFVGYLVAWFSGLIWGLLFGWLCCSVWQVVVWFVVGVLFGLI